MKKFLSIVSLCIVMCMLLVGCDLKNIGKSDNSQDELPKYNAYIELSNYMSQWLESDLEGYYEKFGSEKDINLSKKVDGSTGVITPIIKGTFSDVDKALKYAGEKPSFNSADTSMKALCPKLKALLTTINDIDTYYRSKAYVDDNYAKGKVLHTQLYTQYNDYSAAADKFFKDFEPISENRRKKDLEALKKNDYMITYYAKNIVIDTEAIENDFADGKVNDDSALLSYDLNKYKKRYDKLTSDVDNYVKYSKDSSRLKKEGLDKSAFMSQLSENINRAKASASDIMEVIKTKKLDIGGGKGTVSTNETDFLEGYSQDVSSLVSSYNNVIKK